MSAVQLARICAQHVMLAARLAREEQLLTALHAPCLLYLVEPHVSVPSVHISIPQQELVYLAIPFVLRVKVRLPQTV